VVFSVAPRPGRGGSWCRRWRCRARPRRCARPPGCRRPAAPPGPGRSDPGPAARPGRARSGPRTGARPPTWRSPSRPGQRRSRLVPGRPDSGAGTAWPACVPARAGPAAQGRRTPGRSVSAAPGCRRWYGPGAGASGPGGHRGSPGRAGCHDGPRSDPGDGGPWGRPAGPRPRRAWPAAPAGRSPPPGRAGPHGRRRQARRPRRLPARAAGARRGQSWRWAGYPSARRSPSGRVSWRMPDTYHTAGHRAGTATSTSTGTGTTSSGSSEPPTRAAQAASAPWPPIYSPIHLRPPERRRLQERAGSRKRNPQDLSMRQLLSGYRFRGRWPRWPLMNVAPAQTRAA
jgi:hypothetical protein